jgi:hypothetical protein
MRGALDEAKADLIVSGGKLINLYFEEILSGVENGGALPRRFFM